MKPVRISVVILSLLILITSVPAHAQHHHYKFIDLGTFGGPASYFSNGLDGILNPQGTAVGWADTATADPFPDFCFNADCYVSHAFASQNGVRTDLGTLPGGTSSAAFWISSNGIIAGNAQNGEEDPFVSGLGQSRAVLWKSGKIIDLGTLEGGYESTIASVNSKGQAVGFSMNTVPDDFSLVAPGFYPTQTRAFLWRHGVMEDLGTLGGDDAIANVINERGQIVGNSYTNTTPNATTGLPTLDPFLWENGKMIDLGTLGGTIGAPAAFNNHGEVVGQSNLAGDVYSHAFLWTKQHGMQDLGTLGGNTGVVNWINDAGDIVGKTDLPGSLSPQDHHAVLWRHGHQIDLGALPGETNSNAYNVNSRGAVVGTSEDRAHMLIGVGEHAFLWEGNGPMVDLNTLIQPGASLQLTYAVAINDRGEIAGFGVPPGVLPEEYETKGHAYVLIPCDDDHPKVDGCDYGQGDGDVESGGRALGAVVSGNVVRESAERSRNPLAGHPGLARELLRRDKN
jgi:probable HAF family extracellular repeat protein